ncbi:hypothetical protein Ahy_A10g047596 [Arachis hypogaea]|uniref:SWIM-type domain-containing protein n=1 Tax=Arachis hypogaea TaxID=3818 RepID=A0A445B310_ARAHY|nr:hypothetical protein Ahy_A10g047596 [Arachis hypogaea]
MKDVGLWTISKVVLNHSHSCCPDQAEMLKQHRELSMFVCRTIETHEEARIRPRKTYQSFVAAAGSHCELGFIEKDVRNYITREVWNISEKDDAKEFGKNWNDFLTKYGLEGNKWLSEQVSNSTFNKFVVTYDAVSRDVKCHCLLFESRGILCRHSLSVLSFERVDNVAPKYILERWIRDLTNWCFGHNICEFASESKELTRILHRAFDKVMAEMEEYQERRKRKSLLTHE